MEIEKVQGQSFSIQNVIEKAVTSGGDLATIEKLLELQEKYERREAEKLYHQSMTAFKAATPTILKDKNVSYGNTRYSHASLYNVVETINSELCRHFLSVSFNTENLENGSIKVTCCITHIAGHRECTSLVSPPDTSGKKNSIQAIGSTVSYLQRYTLLALTGLATKDQDNDAQSFTKANYSYITKEQQLDFQALLESKDKTVDAFCQTCKINSLSELTVEAHTAWLKKLEAI